MPDLAADLAADLALAQQLADAADEITVARFGAADLRVDAKPDLTPVTDADRAVEQALRAVLSAQRPADAVLGEEFGADGDAGDTRTAGADDTARRWVIDPIDGTKNFVRGVPVWATLIGLLDGDTPVLGVVSAPALGRRWWAHRGGGSWTAQTGASQAGASQAGASQAGATPRRIAVSDVSRLEDASLSYASLSGWTSLGRRDRFVALLERVWRSRGYGDFWSYMLVAEGAVDVAAEPELSLWDMVALAPIVTEAGGRFTGLDGVDGVMQGNAAASNGRLHAALLDAIGD